MWNNFLLGFILGIGVVILSLIINYLWNNRNFNIYLDSGHGKKEFKNEN